jgi:MFS family permease
LLTAINFLNYIDRNIVFAVFEPVKADLRLTDQELGWLGSAYIILLSLASLPLGVVGDLRSRRGVITFSVGLWSIATALGGFARNYLHLFVSRSLVGVGEAGYGPASQSLIADYFPGQRRAVAIGIYSVGMTLGGVAGIWLGGVIAEAYGWRTAFLAIGAPGLLLALLAGRLREPGERRLAPLSLTGGMNRVRQGVRVALPYVRPLLVVLVLGGLVEAVLALLRERRGESLTGLFAAALTLALIWTVFRLIPAAVRLTATASHAAADVLEEFLQSAAVVLRTPTLIWVFVGGAMVTFTVNGLIAWAPTFLQRELNLSLSSAGAQLGVFGLIAGSLGAVVGGRVGDRMMDWFPGGRVVAAGAGFLVGGPLCVLLLSTTEVGWFTLFFASTFFFYTWYSGPLSAVIFDVVPGGVKSSVMGAFVMFSHLAGDATAPPLVGYLSDQFGIRTAMLVLPTVGMVGGALILVALHTVGADMRRVAGK